MNDKIDLVSVPEKSFWKLSVPLVIFYIFNTIYSIADIMWISQIGVEETFALGVSIPLVSLIFSLGLCIGQGTNSIMSRFIGAGDNESAYNALIHGILLSNITWIICLLCMLFSKEILFYLDKTGSYLLVFDYMVPIVIFAYIFIFVNTLCETLQAEGNSRFPSALLIATNILNIILDPIFIFHLNLGLTGAAYATVISALPAFLIIIYYYLSGRTKIPLSLNYFKFKPYIIVEIIKVGIPNFLNEAIWTFSALFINFILLLTTGTIGPVLYAVSYVIQNFMNTSVKGYGKGLMSVTGHLFGARKFDNLEKMFHYALKVSLITMIIEIIFLIIFRNYIFQAFSITGMDNTIFWIVILGSIALISFPFSMISSRMLDGFGKSIYSLYLTLVKITVQIIIIFAGYSISTSGYCVLIGIVVSEVLIAFAYYILLINLFKNFDELYSKKDTVKTFNEKSTDEIT